MLHQVLMSRADKKLNGLMNYYHHVSLFSSNCSVRQQLLSLIIHPSLFPFKREIVNHQFWEKEPEQALKTFSFVFLALSHGRKKLFRFRKNSLKNLRTCSQSEWAEFESSKVLWQIISPLNQKIEIKTSVEGRSLFAAWLVVVWLHYYN